MELRDLYRELHGLAPGTLARANVAFLLEEGRLKHETGKFSIDSTRLVEVSEAEEMIGADIWHRRVYPVERRDRKPGKISVGRKAGSDIRIELSSVSSEHASLISPARGQWTIADEGSRNGTFVDGNKLTKGTAMPLPVASTVRFGAEVKLTFLDGAAMERVLKQLDPVLTRVASAPPAAPPPRQWAPAPALNVTAAEEEPVARALSPSDIAAVARDGSAPAYELPPPPPPPAPVPGAPARAPAAAESPLALVCDPFPPVGLVTGTPVVVGRAVGCDLILPHPNVSRRHASFLRQGSTVTVEDMGSGNGTWVAKKQVKGAAIAPGTEVGIGPYKLKLTVTKASAPVVDETFGTRLDA
jgi:pSer/pThr/pTyr-binding forkhead associated (FHA) protein